MRDFYCLHHRNHTWTISDAVYVASHTQVFPSQWDKVGPRIVDWYQRHELKTCVATLLFCTAASSTQLSTTHNRPDWWLILNLLLSVRISELAFRPVPCECSYMLQCSYADLGYLHGSNLLLTTLGAQVASTFAARAAAVHASSQSVPAKFGSSP